MPDFHVYAQLYRRMLLEDVIPFWERHSPDREHGGYFTCLERDGRVYDTDKFVWLQARQVWTFAIEFDARVLPAHRPQCSAARRGSGVGSSREGNCVLLLSEL